MTDCGCDKARRDLEEYLRNEVCKTSRPTSPSTSRTAPSCQATRRSVGGPSPRCCARVQGDRSRGAELQVLAKLGAR